MSREEKQEALGKLTPRRLDTVRALIIHYKLDDIAVAAKLRISENTLKRHKTIAFAALGVIGRLELYAEFHELFDASCGCRALIPGGDSAG